MRVCGLMQHSSRLGKRGFSYATITVYKDMHSRRIECPAYLEKLGAPATQMVGVRDCLRRGEISFEYLLELIGT
jgi:hypothetical protein